MDDWFKIHQEKKEMGREEAVEPPSQFPASGDILLVGRSEVYFKFIFK